jgi:hypothetical protein
MHSNFYEVRISKIDPVVTRAPPGMQNMSKIMAKVSTWHAQTKPLMAPIAHQPGTGGCQGTSTSQLIGSVGLGCTTAPAAVPPARDLDIFISNRVSTPAGPLASGAPPKAHAGIAFETRYFGYNTRQNVKSR